MIQELVQVLPSLVIRYGFDLIRLTFDLFESLAVQSSDGVVLLFEAGEASRQGNSDFELLIVQLVRAVGLVIFEGSFHLLDRLNDLMRLISELIFLTRNLGQTKNPKKLKELTYVVTSFN